LDRLAVSARSPAGHHVLMVATSLSRIAGAVVRRRSLVGSCATCHGTVFEDERHVHIHGVLLHRRCTAYRRRAA
jgi:hypothetical protein